MYVHRIYDSKIQNQLASMHLIVFDIMRLSQ